MTAWEEIAAAAPGQRQEKKDRAQRYPRVTDGPFRSCHAPASGGGLQNYDP
jgi:hypothetical protein